MLSTEGSTWFVAGAMPRSGDNTAAAIRVEIEAAGDEVGIRSGGVVQQVQIWNVEIVAVPHGMSGFHFARATW